MPLPEQPAELTPNWLDEALTDAPAFRGRPIRDVRATVIGEGFGLDGTVARLDLVTEGAGAPETIVAKFAAAERGRDEIRFYESLAPRMPIRLPVYFGGRVEAGLNRAILLLEHVAPAEQGDSVRGANRTQAFAMAGTLARFHAAFAGGEGQALACLPAWSARADTIVGDAEARIARFLRRHGAELTGGERACVDDLPDLLYRAEADLTAAPPTLIHGDLHLDNVLFPSPDEPVILDWPDARRGPAVVDLVRLLVDGMTAEFRRRHEAEILNAYAAARAAAGQPVPSPDRCRDLVRAGVVWHLAYAVAWAGAEDPGYDMPRVREIVASLVRNTVAAARDHVTGS